jgi:hypothetical protein
MAADLAAGLHPGRLLHPAAAFAGTVRWLPEELPLLVLAATAEAAIVLWPHRAPRPGVVAALRRRAVRAALAAGHTVTASGFAIGVDWYSGRRAVISWAQAEHGVLLTGSNSAELDEIGLAIACAAVRRRKTVLVLDLAAGGATRVPASCDASGPGVCSRAGLLAKHLGVPVTRAGADAGEAPAMPGAAAGARNDSTSWLSHEFGRAIRSRGVVLASARACAAAQSDAARQAVLSDLIGMLTRLRELGLRGDCLAWLAGCDASDASYLSDLLSLGHATGTAVVLGTTSPGLAADLAARAGQVVASGPAGGNLADAANLAIADILSRQPRGSAATIADGAIVGCGSFRIVPIEVTEVR